MIILGLTGSIGMGKSTTAKMFQEEGIPVYDADAVVHQLYDEGGAGVPIISELFPDSVTDNRVDRQKLGRMVVHDEQAMKKLETAIHPLVGKAQQQFLERARSDGKHLVVLDIPLLFESNRTGVVDYTVVVTAPADLQKQRVLEREGMTEEKFEAILARQIPDHVKRQKADFIIYTDKGQEDARRQVRDLIKTLVEKDAKSAPPD